MSYEPETPFDDIESAQEYVSHLLAATYEAQEHINMEIVRARDPQLARRREALQVVGYKLSQLSTHIATSRRILKDLRSLRRLLVEEKLQAKAASL